MTKIYDVILKDHETHREMLETIVQTSGDTPQRRQAWEAFYYDVKSHAAAEEETFYAPLMEDPDGQDKARHSVSEHKELDDMMEDIRGTDYSSSAWLTKFKDMKHRYIHHIDEEEKEIFERAREVFDEKQEQAAAAAFEKRKAAERKLVEEKREEALEE